MYTRHVRASENLTTTAPNIVYHECDVLHLVKMIYTLTPPVRDRDRLEGRARARGVDTRRGREGEREERGPWGRLGCSAPGSVRGGLGSSLIYTYSQPFSK
jgi:hypothetical protein